MRLLKQPSMFLAACGLIAASNLAAPAYAENAPLQQDPVQQEAKPPTYVVTYQCQSGKFARIITHDVKLNEALQQLSKGETTAAQVLDYVAQNATQELDRTIVFLDVCVGVKFRRT